jgi:hypothetical protein
MRVKLGVVAFGVIEIIIGCVTLLGLMLSLFLGRSAKPPEVLIFVLTTAAISFGLGIGILRRSLTSYHLVIFFSTVVILSKILIFAKIISLSGALETTIPPPVKNLVSVIYHCLLIFYFTRPSVKKHFGERRGASFSLKFPF